MAKSHNKAKKIIFSVFIALLSAILVFAAVEFFYYPHYKKSKTVFDIGAKSSVSEITVMSANVRCISPTDLGKKSWLYRADLIIKNVSENSPDIIGFQEVTKFHYSYLCDSLKGYDSILKYRDDAFFAESCPIFYNTEKFTLVDKNSFWLSETPEEMSKDWGAACYRICSYVILKDKTTDKDFVVFNTHLDHISDEARIKGIGVVLDKISQFGGLPAIIMGDLNADESSETYKSVTQNFYDAKYQTGNTMTSCTYQNWGAKLDDPCIDYFMISKSGIKVNSYKVVTNTYDGVYPSDHFPIVIKLELKEQ